MHGEDCGKAIQAQAHGSHLRVAPRHVCSSLQQRGHQVPVAVRGCQTQRTDTRLVNTARQIYSRQQQNMKILSDERNETEQESNKITHTKISDWKRAANEGKKTQARLHEKTTSTHTDQPTASNELKQQRRTLPHLVHSRRVCASLQQQAHHVGLVLLRRHVKGRLPILQMRRRKVEGEMRGKETERERKR